VLSQSPAPSGLALACLHGGDGFDLGRNWGNDTAVGGPGRDRLTGSAGRDFLSAVDRPSRDVLFGYGGRDRLNARDGRANDYLNGGTGADRCARDAGETAISC
jgi:Ca2+-binding RTX toxin-like protein